jgi:hypothetical protein
MFPLERWNLALDQRREQREKELEKDASSQRGVLDTTEWRMHNSVFENKFIRPFLEPTRADWSPGLRDLLQLIDRLAVAYLEQASRVSKGGNSRRYQEAAGVVQNVMLCLSPYSSEWNEKDLPQLSVQPADPRYSGVEFSHADSIMGRHYDLKMGLAIMFFFKRASLDKELTQYIEVGKDGEIARTLLYNRLVPAMPTLYEGFITM